MPRNPRNEVPYDPIRADLVREVTAPMRSPMEEPNRRLVLSVPAAKPAPVVESTITKRFVLSRGEDAEVNAFLLRLQAASGSKVPLSVVVRAALAIVMAREEPIVRGATQLRPQLPSTHDRLALGVFEEHWRVCFQGALQPR